MLAIEAAVTGPAQWSTGLVVSLLVLALFPSLIANLFWNRAVLAVGPGRAAGFGYLLPVFSVAAAVLLLGEKLYAFHWFGAALIFLGIALATRARERPRLLQRQHKQGVDRARIIGHLMLLE
jgi:drug/metabolite transporter (DMT)-like permease